MSLDLLYLTYNRLEFTRHSWSALFDATDWSLVDRFVVYDDKSTDGTFEYMREQVDLLRAAVDVEVVFNMLQLRSPVAVMNHYLDSGPAELFAKVDNDIVMPPGWLNALLQVMTDHPELELLGTEAGRIEVPEPGFAGPYTYENGTHIGGVGLMRSNAFLTRRRMIPIERFGFTEWQHKNQPVRGWIKPDLLVSELGRLPFEPWSGLTDYYIDRRWQRPWGKYDPKWTRPYWGWWASNPEEDAA